MTQHPTEKMFPLGAERRRSPRIELLLKIDYLDPADLLGDYITNMGGGGLFVCTSLQLEPGTHLRFALSFPGLLAPVELAGVVRWRQRAADAADNGLGVEFVFADDQERQRVAELIESLRHAAGPISPRRLSVLLVEDNEFARELFAVAVQDLEQAGVEASPLHVLAASDARQAVEILASTAVDLLIVDYYLPGMTGCDLVRQLRRDPRMKQVPILMVSVGGDSVKEEALACGVDLYLDKPVLRRQLVETLRTLVTRSPAGGA